MSKIGIISDVHSNMEALTTALGYLNFYGVDNILCLGDVVGYGPDPGECLEVVRGACGLVIQGNHDAAVSDQQEYSRMNSLAKAGVDHARNVLDEKEKRYLAALPREGTYEGITMAHGSLTSDHFDYILDTDAASENFQIMPTNLLLVGHSHMAFVSDRLVNGIEDAGAPAFYTFRKEGAEAVRLREDVRYIINPGSVGQPRDVPLGGFCVYDSDNRVISFVRFPYDIEKTKIRIIEAGLPDLAWQRLFKGK